MPKKKANHEFMGDFVYPLRIAGCIRGCHCSALAVIFSSTP